MVLVVEEELVLLTIGGGAADLGGADVQASSVEVGPPATPRREALVRERVQDHAHRWLLG